MPIIQFKHCTVEGDLAQALLDLEQYIGETSESLTQGINGIESPSLELSALEGKLDEILQYSPVPSNSTQIATEVGIPLPFATSKDDELRLEQHGLILINGVLWKKGSSTNIQNYRRLYFALGEDLQRFFAALNTPKGFVVVQRKINVYKLPTKPAWTVDEVRVALSNYSIEKVYQKGSDFYAVSLQYLAQDISKDQAVIDFTLTSEQILTEVFWINEVKNDSATITKLRNLGITESYLSAVIVGRNLYELRSDLIDESRLKLNQHRLTINSQIDFLKERLSVLTAQAKETLKKEILKSIKQAEAEAGRLQQYVRFSPLVVPTKSDLDLFLLKNTSEDLEYLFKDRRSVQSIDFTAQNTDIIERVRQLLNIQVGNTTTSTLMLNNPYVEVNTLTDFANFECVKFLCAKTKVSATDYSFVGLQVAQGCLIEDYIEPVTPDPVQGYPSFDSPATLIQRNVNWVVTLNTDAAMNALDALGNSAANALRPLIAAIAQANKQAQNAIDKFFNDLNSKVSSEIRNVESFMSRYMSFFGTVGVESSLLKCALGFNLNADLPFLNDILPLIEALRRKVKSFLAQIIGLVSRAIEEIISLPLRLINQLLEGVEDFLPAFCKVNRVQLPSDVEANLAQLRQGSQVQNESAISFNQALARLQASAESLPTKFDSFRSNVSSQDSSGSRFLKEFKKQANISVDGNPLSGVAEVLGL